MRKFCSFPALPSPIYKQSFADEVPPTSNPSPPTSGANAQPTDLLGILATRLLLKSLRHAYPVQQGGGIVYCLS